MFLGLIASTGLEVEIFNMCRQEIIDLVHLTYRCFDQLFSFYFDESDRLRDEIVT